MPIESELFNFALNNGVGVLFGVLMWIQANNTIKKNTEVTGELKDAIILLVEKLNGQRPN